MNSSLLKYKHAHWFYVIYMWHYAMSVHNRKTTKGIIKSNKLSHF